MKVAKATVVLCAALWVLAAPRWSLAEEDYVAKKGLELTQRDLQGLVQQIQSLGAGDQAQRELLDRLFQMKVVEVERLFDVMEPGDAMSRQAASLCALKAVEQHALGNWVQAYASMQDAERWDKSIRSGTLKIGAQTVGLAAFWDQVEQEALKKGGSVRFLIRPFAEDKMLRPDTITLDRKLAAPERPRGPSSGALTDFAAATAEASTGPARPAGRSPKPEAVSGNDSGFLSERFRKALRQYFYDPVEAKADFSLFLPNGSYEIRDRDFALQPVDFEVSGEQTKVVLQPADWFRLTFSQQVHPSEIAVSVDGTPWADLAHVPFGKCRIEVKNPDYTYSTVRVVFVRKDQAGQVTGAPAQGPEAPNTVVVEDRGVCKLALREREGGEKLRYSLLGY